MPTCCATATAWSCPGVGAFPEAMRRLHALGLAELIRSRAAEGVPVLGICLGMQVLLERSDELQPTDGLGLIRGEVTRLDTRGLRVPHIGWNEVDVRAPVAADRGPPAGRLPLLPRALAGGSPGRSR